MISTASVDHQCNNEIHGGVRDLQQDQSLRKVVGVSNLQDEAEEGDVRGISEYDIANADEGRGKLHVVPP